MIHPAPSTYAERHFARLDQHAAEVREAEESLRAHFLDAVEKDPARSLATPCYAQKSTPAHEILHEVLGTYTEGLAELMQAALRGEDVQLRAQMLVTLAAGEYAATHAEEMA